MHIKDVEKYIVERRGVIHVGANDGGERDWYDQMGFETVIWFEPIQEVFLKLKENISKYPKQSAINLGIHDTLNSAVIHVASNQGQSSSILEFGTHKKLRPDITYVRDEEIVMVRADDIMRATFVKKFNFLVVDVQGVELNVLKSFGLLLTMFDYIYTEVNTDESYVGCALMPEIDTYLSGFGFNKIKYFVDKKWNWGDAFYAKK